MYLNEKPPVDCVEYAAQKLGVVHDDLVQWIIELEQLPPVDGTPKDGDVVLYIDPNDKFTNHVGIWCNGQVISKLSATDDVVTTDILDPNIVARYGSCVRIVRLPQ